MPNTGTVATKFFTCYWEKLHSNHLQEERLKQEGRSGEGNENIFSLRLTVQV